METPSTQQQAVLDWVENGKGSLNLVARAGCGKTSTLLMVTRKTKGETILLAYNKAIAEEIKVRLVQGGTHTKASAQTVHALGFSSWMRVAKDAKVAHDKVAKIVRGFSQKPDDFYVRNVPNICKLVSLAKQCAFGFLVPITNQQAWFDMAEHHNIEDDLADEDTIDQLVNASIMVLEKSIALDRQEIDFDDMILAPLVHNAPVYEKDWILLDEAQDTNSARRALALKCLKPITGRLIAVGDDRQAIYGFTGADSDAMDLIKNQLNSQELKLTVTYRCPKAVVKEANRLVPDLVAHESAPEGIVRAIATSDKDGQPWFKTEPPAITSAILCRNTKPLIEQAYQFLAAGIGCKVEGREIGEGLVSLAKRWKNVSTTHQLAVKLADYKVKEMQKFLAKGQEDRAEAVEDKVGALMAVISRVNSQSQYLVQDVVTSIRSLFGDTKAGEKPRVVTLATVHKSKGREWETVYILDRANLMPSKYARKEWQMRQEENLEYVAITRSKNQLIDLVMPRKEA